MSEAAISQSLTELPLQSLINTRHDVQKLHSISHRGGRDFPGQRLAQRRGQGIEFLDLRQYVDGDDVRHIDWNVTARTNEPYTRLYKQEKEQTTVVLVDLRSVMFNGSECLRAVAAGRLAAATLWQAAHDGDRCASIVIDSQTINATRPLRGNNGVLQALQSIAQGFRQTAQRIEPGNHSARDNTGLSDVLDMVINTRRDAGRYFLFSGFDTENDTRYRHLLPAAAVKNLHAVHLLDKLELHALPYGAYQYLHNNKSGLAQINSTSKSALYNALQDSIDTRQSRLYDAGIKVLEADTNVAPREFLTTLQRHGWM